MKRRHNCKKSAPGYGAHDFTWGQKGLVRKKCGFDFTGADERSRTADLLITNQLLYQLSYVGQFQKTLYNRGVEQFQGKTNFFAKLSIFDRKVSSLVIPEMI